MQYTKQALTFDDQANKLMARGLQCVKADLIEKLKAVSYYRLSGYSYPFRNPDDSFQPGTTLDIVWNRYVFDRQLRLLVLDGIERVEVAVRTDLIYLHAHQFGPFGYLDHSKLPSIPQTRFDELQAKISDEYGKSNEGFINHFKSKYGDVHSRPPIWMMTELMTFGMLLTFFRGIAKTSKATIAARYGVADDVFESWLQSLNVTRNICAHHSRLWNRVLGTKPTIPRGSKNRQWQIPLQIGNRNIFGILSVLQHCMKVNAPKSRWKTRFEDLLLRHPTIPIAEMGMAPNWKDSPIWK